LEIKKFGDFDLNRQLTSFEMKNFNAFMKPVNTAKDSRVVSLTKATKRIIKEADKFFK